VDALDAIGQGRYAFSSVVALVKGKLLDTTLGHLPSPRWKLPRELPPLSLCSLRLRALESCTMAVQCSVWSGRRDEEPTKT
jgi:hypothetical protein